MKMNYQPRTPGLARPIFHGGQQLEVDELLVIDFIEKIKNVSSPSFRICKNLLKMLNPKIVYKPLHFLEIGQNTVTHISNFRPIYE
jgi:hypothetical protein